MKRNIVILILVSIFSFALGILVPLRANIGSDRSSPVEVRRIPSPRETIELLDIVKIWKATKELNLTSEQLQTFIPKFNRVEETKRRYYTERKNLVSQIRELLNDSDSSEDQIQQLEGLLRRLRELDEGFDREIKRAYEDLNSDLTVVQRGKLVLFLENYRREIRRILMQMKEMARSRKR
jgi:chromosome segregation ATPase